MSSFLSQFSRARASFAAASGGNVALIFGLTFPVLLGVAGLGIDSAAITNQRSKMQAAADSTALAVGKEMNLSLEDLTPQKQSGLERAEALLSELGIADHPHEVEITFDKDKSLTRVEIRMETKTFLPPEVWGENPIVVDAEANTLGTKLCVLSLKGTTKDVLQLGALARVSAPDCAVQSNSKDPAGLTAMPLTLLTSAYTCSSGGFEGDLSLFVPAPDTDCPTVDDPLELRAPPVVGGCDFDGLVIDMSQTIAPGHYCGGLTIKGSAQVTAEAGVYIISGGVLEVRNSATLSGEGVGFYFADDDATFNFKNNAVVELSGPTSGPLAGILFYENPSAKQDREFKISSNEVRKLIGTIYLPRGTFKASAKLEGVAMSLLDPLKNIGAASTYTIIVANKIELDGVNLVINADYAASDVPVPTGLGPKSSKVRLVK